ncbi:MAG TPA: hypothetical protein VKE69_08470, partial [Planctomycetota bacterium]|nr:hypothetical protein [Planctomycetota bacterium]
RPARRAVRPGSIAPLVALPALLALRAQEPPASSASRPASAPARVQPLVEVERFLGEPMAAPLDLSGQIERKTIPPIPDADGARTTVAFRFDGKSRFLASTQTSTASGAIRTQVVAGTDDGFWRGAWLASGGASGLATGACEILPPVPLDKRLEFARTQLRGPDLYARVLTEAARGDWTSSAGPDGATRTLRYRADPAAPASRQVSLDAAEITLGDGATRTVTLRGLLSTPDGGKTEIAGRFTFTRERAFTPADFEVHAPPGVTTSDRRGR